MIAVVAGAAILALLPLALTSILCEALMVLLGIGVKVATLPVIALGVGIGVDYALYLLSVQLNGQRRGLALPDAYRAALAFTGRIVALVGFTLAAGVITWAWSPIKFQADMGVLLTFMFLWNMVDLNRIKWEGADALTPGRHTVTFDFKYDGPGLGKGGTGTLSVDGRVLSRDQLLDRVWGKDIYVDTRTVDVHVGRLRKALSVEGAGEDPIRTVRGSGYALG